MIAKYFKEIVRSPFIVLNNLYLYRHILIHMIIRELKGRFAGSMGGMLWHFVHPVLMLIIFLFVFVYIFKVRIGTGGNTTLSSIYLMSGLFPWIILAEGLSRGTSSLIENANLIQKTFFPTEILTAKAVVTPLLSYGIAMIILSLYTVFFLHNSAMVIIILPIILLMQILFTLGIAFLTSTISVFFRDIMQFVQVLISFWIYLTPILYPVDMLPGWARMAMYINPLYPLISVYQSLLIKGVSCEWNMLFLSLCWSLSFFVMGAFFFTKLKYEFADWL
jgi:lipopolysaccharide transport system permease protein